MSWSTSWRVIHACCHRSSAFKVLKKLSVTALSQQVGFNGMTVSAVGCHLEPLCPDNTNVMLAHQTFNATMPDRRTGTPEFLCHAGMSVASPALSVNGADMHYRDVILSSAGTDRTLSPGSQTPITDPKQAADSFARKWPMISSNKGKPQTFGPRRIVLPFFNSFLFSRSRGFLRG